MNSAKRRFIAVICFTALTLTGCGMSAESQQEYTNSPAYNVGTEITEPATEIETTTTHHTTETKTGTTTSANDDVAATTEKSKSNEDNRVGIETVKATSESKVPTEQNQDKASESQNDTPKLAVTTKADTETETTNTETIIHSDSAMYDENDNEIPTYIPKTDPVVIEGDGNVSLIGTLQEQMGKEPLRVSKEESQMLISMLNEIELQPVDSPDRASIPFGGGYIMNIEGGERYILLGGRYLQIGDKYYYDANNKSDALSSKIGSVLYSYYGEP